MNIFDALSAKKIKLELRKSAGRKAAEYVYIYPPDIPLIVPGEIITEDMIFTILDYKEKGLNVISDSAEPGKNIYVVEEE